MRMWTLPLLALASSFALHAQESAIAKDAAFLKELRIPVELSKGIKVERVHPGDIVRLRMAEAILAGKGVVVPGNAKLVGKVVHAHPVEQGKPSYLSILVERAEWKGHSVPLRAYVTGWGSRRIRMVRPCGPSFGAPSRARRRSGPTTISSGDAVFDDCAGGQTQVSQIQQWDHSKITSSIDIYRNTADGSTILVSRKNIHLPSGILMVLQNMEPLEVTAKETPLRH